MNERKYGRVNIYRCKDCGWSVVTKDVDDGVTPFLIACRACSKGLAQSSFYNVRQDLDHAAEWRHEMPEEYKGDRDSIKHFEQGGLFLFWLDPKPGTLSTREKLRQIGIGKKLRRIFP